MAGHSKFANIKHKKAKNDAIRGKLFTRFGREIMIAAREGGSDLTTNPRLKEIVRKAKSSNMPNDTIDRAIKRGVGELGDAIFEEIRYEGYGPSGVAIIVDALTDNRNRSAANIRSAFTKGSGNLGTSGCVSFMFQEKGVILIEKSEHDEDELMEFALENGASDFLVEDEGYVINTTREDYFTMMDAIETKGIDTLSAELTLVPDTYISLNDEADIKNMDKILALLDEENDVQEVYTNLDE
ncbi:MAG: YebC/PmpR family DNA-binding transcriptional regulator [Lachnospirales bacterium]